MYRKRSVSTKSVGSGTPPGEGPRRFTAKIRSLLSIIARNLVSELDPSMRSPVRPVRKTA